MTEGSLHLRMTRAEPLERYKLLTKNDILTTCLNNADLRHSYVSEYDQGKYEVAQFRALLKYEKIIFSVTLVDGAGGY